MGGRPRTEDWLQELRAFRRVALDTNVVIYALEHFGLRGELARHLLLFIERGYVTAVVSSLVLAETLVKPLRQRDWAAVSTAELFFRESTGLQVRACDRQIARRAAEVRARTQLRLPDAIIVATALEERCEVLIGNDTSMARRAFGIPYIYLDDYVV